MRVPFIGIAIGWMLAACVGDDPGTAPATTPEGATSSSSSSSSGGTSEPSSDGGGGTSSSSSSSSGDAAVSPECTKIQVTTLSGTGAAGLVNGAGAVAKFNGAKGIAVDSSGTLFVADSTNKVIRKVLADGTTSTHPTMAGVGVLPPTGFDSLERIQVRGSDFYVVDPTHDAVMRVVPSGSVSNVTTVGGAVAVGANPFSATIMVSTTQECSVQTTTGTIFTGGTCGFRDGVKAVARVQRPIRDFTFDAASNAYAVDSGNFAVRKIAADGSITTLGAPPVGTSNDAGANNAQFDQPKALTIQESKGVLYVTDKTRIKVVTIATGQVTTLVGANEGFDNGNGCVAKFTDLQGIAYFGNALYAVDVNRIRKIALPP